MSIESLTVLNGSESANQFLPVLIKFISIFIEY